jgi:hypothetical protein
VASWIVHLRVADQLARFAGEAVGEFALGNIAPDSGVPDAKWETFDPPPSVTHFKDGTERTYPIGDLVFYRRYISGNPDMSVDIRRSAFLHGYFCHLVTDNLWYSKITRPTYAHYKKEFDEDPQFIWTVKKDWYGLDFCYLKEHSQWPLWQTFKDVEYSGILVDFLPPAAVTHKLNYIREYYGQSAEAIDTIINQMPNRYLNIAEMNYFVQSTADRLTRLLTTMRTDPLCVDHKASLFSVLETLD